ncbi:FUSC family protein [Amycolatopsis sp. NPDC051373]|uniref:FUSC family protein n=1 Tax=Amycolatopsis sp. NPDC051373 TaxID=3155801 RepID=UPI00345016FF
METRPDDVLGQGVRTPVGWLSRALRVPGRERRTLVQAAKAALAAAGAWLLATLVLRLPQPFLAPYAAVFLVETTVYRSVRGWVQQVGAVGAGVVLAGLAGQVIPWPAVALGLVVFVGLLIGSWRRFGESGVWVGVTGMLLIAYGTPAALLGDRLVETAIGAAIGAVVNALVFPPLSGRRLVEAIDALAGTLAGFLGSTAGLIRAEQPPDDVEDWLGEARELRSVVAVTADAIRRTREERVLNLRRRRSGTVLDQRAERLIDRRGPHGVRARGDVHLSVAGAPRDAGRGDRQRERGRPGSGRRGRTGPKPAPDVHCGAPPGRPGGWRDRGAGPGGHDPSDPASAGATRTVTGWRGRVPRCAPAATWCCWAPARCRRT